MGTGENRSAGGLGNAFPRRGRSPVDSACRSVVLSDLHLGDGSKADDFGPSNGRADVELIQFVEALSSDTTLIIAGDLLELWQAPLWAIKRAHGAALRTLMERADIYVIGNHDKAMIGTKLYGLRGVPYWSGELGGERTLIEHGHIHDPVVANAPRLARIFTRVVGYLERYVHRDVDRWASAAWCWLTRTGRHGGNERYVPLVARDAYAMGCTRAIFGHTHKRMLWTVARIYGRVIRVANAGTWTNGRQDVLFIGGERMNKKAL